jgi:hypothetical protein
MVLAAAMAMAMALGCTTWGARGALLHADDFARPLAGFVAEYAQKPGNLVANRDGRLVIDVDGGATVWYEQPLRMSSSATRGASSWPAARTTASRT